MECPGCGHENREGARFCDACGAGLNPTCSACGAALRAGARFCDSCGSPVGGSAPRGSTAGGSSVRPVAVGQTSTEQPQGQGAPAVSPGAPESFANGRYAVKRFLGEGGKKRVYLAHDTTLARDVAFALIKTEGLDAEGRERITREAQAMGKLGTHPHVVSVFDMGIEPPATPSPSLLAGGAEGTPYIVTELMQGGDVEGLLEHAPEHRLALADAVSLAVQVCRGLEFAHSHGLVHRDLKPGNVWLTGPQAGSGGTKAAETAPHHAGREEIGTAKIGDFGLAVSLDRSRLTRAGMMVGTVSYMPPEQAMGGEVSPRSDLYSLGAMLYEMVTGRPPFVGDDSISVIGQHLNTPPVAPTWHRSDCPPALEELILRLLEKDPMQRPPGAREVRADLEAMDLRAAPREAPQEDALQSLAAGTFVGRAPELAQGKAAVDASLSGRAGLLLLAGDRGMGKTRLAEEIATYASLRGALVLWGRTHEAGGAPAYWPWIQALRSYVRTQEPARLRSELGSAGPQVAKVVSDVREQLPDLPEASPGDPAQERFRLFDGLASFLRNATVSQPLTIILENLHWADQPTLMLLQFLVQEIPDARLLVLGTYRDTDLGRRHPLSQFLADTIQERRVQRVALKGLAEAEAARMMDALAGGRPGSSLASRVYQATEGVPLFIEEMVRLLAQEGRLNATESLLVPESLRDVVGRRLDRLSEETNEALTVAAVAGREFDLALLREMTGRDEDGLLELMEEAVKARVLEEAALGRYRFSHALTPETLLAELSTARRVRLHGRAGLALERLYGAQAERHAAELAYHFGQAGALSEATEKAVHYAVMAARQAETSHAYEEGVRHYEAAIALVEDAGQPLGQDPVALRRGLALAQRGVFRMVDSFRNFRRAMYLARERGDGQTVAELAVEMNRTGFVNAERRIQILTEGLQALPDPDSETAVLLHARLAESLSALARREEAADQLQRAEGLAGSYPGGEGEAWVAFAAFMLALHRKETGRLAELEARVEGAEARAGRRVLWSGSHWRALWPMLTGDLQGARSRTRGILEYAQRTRNPYDIVSLSLASAVLACCSGDLSETERLLIRAREWSGGEPDSRIHMIGWYVALARGDLGEARNHALAAKDVFVQLRRAAPPAPGLLILSEAERRAGNTAAGQEAFQEAALTRFLGARESNHLDFTARLGLLAAAWGDATVMQSCEEFLALHRDLFAMADAAIPAFASVRRVLGVMAGAQQRWAEAVEHLERGVAACEEKGLPVELAPCRLALSDALMHRNPGSGEALDRPPDSPALRDRATILVDQALADFQRLGMPLFAQDALARREVLGA